ncbi:urea ABC transporter permease subunit UrtB [Algisphaera agarilytica]|uniref:Urea transport system permease protein n=1 Tax=Algisphaera agarilytica TaxID=1385975 RepID=A0A7X0LJ51_9BACT|nr:urea ABC transporter permease subunit UrtB [Algisphaera agarilytica]MBB6428236.1 urea transport system permease protein [Algisphaera agarilytica]
MKFSTAPHRLATRTHSQRKAGVYSLLLLLVATALFVFSGTYSPTATAQDTPAEEPAAAEASTDELSDDELLELAVNLGSSKLASETVEQLIGMGDARVLRLFERLMANELRTVGDRLVWEPPALEGESPAEAGAPLLLNAVAAERELLDLETLKVDGELPKSKSFRGNRKARKVIQQRLSLMGLDLKDPVIREESARNVGNKRQLEALPKLLELAENDPEKAIRRTAEESANLIVASGTDPEADEATRVAAIAGLGELKSIRGLDVLKEVINSDDSTPAMVAAAEKSTDQINRHISVTNWIKNAFFGMSAGSIFVLVALGLAITFGLMGVINMAHGEMLMIGAVATWACFEFLSTNPFWSGDPMAALGLSPNWAYVVAFFMAFTIAAITGLLVEVSIVRFLYKRPLDSLLATIGVSYILIQLVRNWKGDNLPLTRPDWSAGGWEVYPDIVLGYSRMFIIALTAFCLAAVVVIFRFTKIGLMVRATVQNRAMAQTLGVNTRVVDMFCFAFGAGLAGLAGFGVYLIGNTTPQMGQGYIVDSFLVVVVGGVGKLLGVVISGLGLGTLEKILEPIVLIEEPIRLFDSTWAKVAVLLLVVLFIQRRPSGLFPEKGRAASQATGKDDMPWLGRPTWRTDAILGGLLVIVGLVVIPALYLSGNMSIDTLNRYGYFTCFAICAVGLDLIWGYMGVLSLCQFLFFAFGSYCMGFYLINIGPKDVNGIPECLAYVMSDVANPTPPWYLAYFQNLGVSFLLAMLLPGLVAAVIGVMMFRSRVKGVYFAILTQAITVIAWRVFQKNDLKMGGTNGIRVTFSEELFGNPIAFQEGLSLASQTRFKLYILSVIALIVTLIVAKAMVRSGYGRILLAIRDDETRLRFSGYQPWVYKALTFTVAGMMAGLGGALYFPQKGIITPTEMEPSWSILVVAWVAFGGRGTLWGAVLGALAISQIYNFMTSEAPEYWMYVLGGLFILVPLLLPGGLMSIPTLIGNGLSRSKPGGTPPPPAVPASNTGGAA